MYVDKLRFWVKRPLSSSQIGAVSDACGNQAHAFAEKRLRGGWRQRIDLHQPQEGAFALLRDLGIEALINKAEIALDAVVDSRQDAQNVQDLVYTHWYQPWHGNQQYNNFRGTEYSGSRSARNNHVAYSDRPCRITGDPHCAHFERRITGVSALGVLGIRTFADLVNFDYFGFWEKNLRLYSVSLDRLGRAAANRVRKSKRRSPLIADYGYGIRVNVDARLGRALVQEAICDENGFFIRDPVGTQQVVDKYGVVGRKAVQPLPVDWLLKSIRGTKGLQG